MVRHFDRELPASLAEAFADLVRASQAWIDRHPEISGLVRVEQPIEVGRDFVARLHHVYYTSTRSYLGDDPVEDDEDDEDNYHPPEAPPELDRMRSAFRAAIGASDDPRDAIVETVLARSIIEPSGKTVFDEQEGRFIVVEPKPLVEEVQRWAALKASPQLMMEKRKRPAAMDAVRDFLQSYVHDADMDDVQRIPKHTMSVNPWTIIEGVEGIEEILASPLEPGALARLVAEDANRGLDDPSARAWLQDLANRVRAWMGLAGAR